MKRFFCSAFCIITLIVSMIAPCQASEALSWYCKHVKGHVQPSVAPELSFVEEYLPDFRPPRTVSVATGAAAYETIAALAKKAEAAVEGLTVRVYRIVNHFFGESVTVAGLLTGRDVSEQLCGQALGDELLFPAVMLRADGDVFLDDMTPEELSRRLGVPVRAVGSDGAELLRAFLGV